MTERHAKRPKLGGQKVKFATLNFVRKLGWDKNDTKHKV